MRCALRFRKEGQASGRRFAQKLLCCIKGDGRRIRNIERFDLARHVETGKRRDGFARLLAQALAFGAQHQCDFFTAKGLFDGGGAFRIQTDGEEAELVQLAQRIGQIGDLDIGNEFQRTGSRFRQHA